MGDERVVISGASYPSIYRSTLHHGSHLVPLLRRLRGRLRTAATAAAATTRRRGGGRGRGRRSDRRRPSTPTADARAPRRHRRHARRAVVAAVVVRRGGGRRGEQPNVPQELLPLCHRHGPALQPPVAGPRAEEEGLLLRSVGYCSDVCPVVSQCPTVWGVHIKTPDTRQTYTQQPTHLGAALELQAVEEGLVGLPLKQRVGPVEVRQQLPRRRPRLPVRLLLLVVVVWILFFKTCRPISTAHDV